MRPSANPLANPIRNQRLYNGPSPLNHASWRFDRQIRPIPPVDEGMLFLIFRQLAGAAKLMDLDDLQYVLLDGSDMFREPKI